MSQCPICQSHKAKLVIDLQYIQRKTSFLPGIIFRCRGCGAFFKKADFAIAEVYNKDYAQQAKNLPRVKNGGLDYFASEQLGTPANNRLLDIGAATGNFVELMTKRGWIAEGLEVIEVFCESARQRRLNFYCQSIDDFEAWDNYTHFTMLDVIEHLQQPVSVLERISRIAPPKAMLLVLTPNHHSILIKLSLWLYKIGIKSMAEEIFGCTHIVFFTPSSLKMALNNGGWEIKSSNWRSYRAADAGGGPAGLLHYLAHFVDLAGSLMGLGKYRLLVVAERKP